MSRKRKPGGGNRLLGVLNDTWAENEVIATLKEGSILDGPRITDIPEKDSVATPVVVERRRDLTSS